jgi:hypothetical protein
VAQRQEVSDVHAKLAKARADWTVSLQERARTAEPGDMSFADKFNEDFGAYLSEFGNGVKTEAGRRAFKAGAADLSAQFTVKASEFQAASAGQKARQDYGVLVDANRNTLISDPSQFDSILKSTTDALNDPNGPYARMPAQARSELAVSTRQAMALSAVQGTVDLTPELALKQLKTGRWDEYLDADKKNSLINNAEIGIRAREVEAERLAAQKERELRKAQQATGDGFVARLYGDTPDLTPRDVIRSNLTWEQKKQWIGDIEQRAKEQPMKTDSALMVKLWDRIHLPDGDPNKLVNEDDLNGFYGRGLKAEDIRSLRTEMQGRRTEAGQIEGDLKKNVMTIAKSALTRTNDLTGIRDPRGDEQMQRFMSLFLPEYQKQRQAGKSAVELLSPDSKDYMGKLIEPFKRPLDVITRDLIESNKVGEITPDKPAAPAKEYTSAADVTADFKAGKLTRAQAADILKKKGWAN